MLEEKFQDIKKSLDSFLEGFYDFQKSENNNIDLKRRFSIINLPSKGTFYPNKKKSLLIRYLSAIEENILTDSLLMESGKGIELILNNLIIDNDINIRDLLLSDFQALLIFLRSTAYGDSITFPYECPSCKKEGEFMLYLSKLEFKENEDEPDENNEFAFCLSKSGLSGKTKLLTFGDEIENIEKDTEDFIIYKDLGINTKIKTTETNKLVSAISELNGVRDKNKIKKIIKNIPKYDAIELNKFIEKNKIGVKNIFNHQCEFCSHDFQRKLDFGYDFLSLPSNYANSVAEEVFLITYYGKGITWDNAEQMPVFSRKWHINRIEEEIEKKNKAEEKAVQQARMNKGKIR